MINKDKFIFKSLKTIVCLLVKLNKTIHPSLCNIFTSGNKNITKKTALPTCAAVQPAPSR